MGHSLLSLRDLAARAEHNISLLELGVKFLDMMHKNLPHATEEDLDEYEANLRELRGDWEECQENSNEFAAALAEQEIASNGAPDWYQEGLDEGREGSQWPEAPATPPRSTTQNDEPPNQKSKYQRAKDRGYYQCLVPDCPTRARHGRLCKKHAGPQLKPQCEFNGCDNIAQSRGLCHSHNPATWRYHQVDSIQSVWK